MNINKIIDAIQSHQIRITDHADVEAQSDNLKYEEIFFSVLHGEIIEHYLEDKPYPSCLILGETPKGEPIHSVWGYNKKSRWVVLITVYRPDPTLWIDYKIRKKKT